MKRITRRGALRATRFMFAPVLGCGLFIIGLWYGGLWFLLAAALLAFGLGWYWLAVRESG